MPGRNIVRFASHRTGNCCVEKIRGYPSLPAATGVWFIPSDPYAGSRTEPASGCEVSVIGAGFTGLNASRKLRRNRCRVKCRSGRFFQKYLLPEGHVSTTLRKQNSQTGRKNGATFVMAGRLQRTSDRQGFVPWESSPRKGNSVRSTDRISAREPPG
jgi:hypothetical protein